MFLGDGIRSVMRPASRPNARRGWRLLGVIIASALVIAGPLAGRSMAQDAEGADLDPQARIVKVEPIIAPDGELWVRLHFEKSWDEMPPLDLFSIWFGIGTATDTAESWAGWELHDGVSTPYESSGSRGDAGAMVLDDGTVILATGLFPHSAIGMSVLMASWLNETSTARQTDQLELGFQPEEYLRGNPLEMFGTPTYNLLTGTPVGQTTPEVPSDEEQPSETPEPSPTPEPDPTPEPEPTPSEDPAIAVPLEESASDDAATPAVANPQPSEDASAAPTTSQTNPDDGLTTAQKVALATVLVFLIWMAYVYFSTQLVGVAPDPCADEKAAVAAAKKRLDEANADQKAKGDARHDAETDRSNAPFAKKDMRGVLERAEKAVEEASKAEDQAKTRTQFAQNELVEAETALTRCEKRAESDSEGGTTTSQPPPGPSAPTDPTSEPAPEPDCCPSGNWIGINVFSGGMLFVGGMEWGLIHFVCLDNPDRTALVAWRGARGGLGLGAEISGGLFLVVGGPKHPNELEKSVESTLSGVDFDLSLGTSWTKLAKAGVKTGRNVKKLKAAVEQVRDGSKALDKARKAGNIEEATRISAKNAEVLKDLVRDGTAGKLADTVAEVTTKGGLSAGQTKGTGVHIPLGIGLQAGVWYTGWINATLQSWDGCEKCGRY